jgi:DNA-binding MarR family transcriptional regulator
MEKGGPVARRADERHERVSRVYLTDAGRDTRPAVEGAWKELNQQMFAGSSAGEVALLYGYLLCVCENTESGS